MSSPHNEDTCQEIELKLALGNEARTRLIESELLRPITPMHMTLGNRYYDTAEKALRAHTLALRIRKGEGNQLIQTLKSAGHSHGGLSQRGEWQWKLNDDALNLEVLRNLSHHSSDSQPELAILSDEAVLHQLQTIFVTDFERLVYRLEWQGSSVELAMDNGYIMVADQRRTINEVELELKGGDPHVLWSLAEQLAQYAPLRPANASKASRAAALINPVPLPHELPTEASALFATAIAGLDAAQDSPQPSEGNALAQRALQQLGKCHAYPFARQMAAQLQQPNWSLTLEFGQWAMGLAKALA